MARVRNQRAVLVAWEPGPLTPAAFEVIDEEMVVDDSKLAPGEVWLRSVYATLEPYMQACTLKHTAVGRTIEARSLCVVHASRSQELRVGDTVWGFFDLEVFVRLPATLLDRKGYPVLQNKVSIADWPANTPLTRALSVLGLTGLTAWSGIVEVARAKAGDTVFVSSAAGAVGLLAGQIAKTLGCHVIGCAGSDEKCRVARAAGFDACFNYRSLVSFPLRTSQATHCLAQTISKHCARGVDVFFDCVGGPVLDAAFIVSKPRARIVVCGALSENSLKEGEPRYEVRFLPIMIEKMITMRGFTVFDYFPQKMEEYLAQMRQWLQGGKVTVFKEHIVKGLENMPNAFCGMLRGDFMGQTVVNMSDDGFASHWAASDRENEDVV